VTLDDFWALIHRSSLENASKDERTEWLTARLAQLPAPEIVEFELHLMSQRKPVDTRLVWGAAWHIMRGWCSDDGFWYFQPWLVGLGRDAQGLERVCDADPEDEPWDYDDTGRRRARLPRLTALLG
jgi:hypothetical protein